MDDWLIIYRDYTDEELAAEIARLKEEITNPYLAQGIGSKNYQLDRGGIKNQLSAAIRVKSERAGRPVVVDTVADFSEVGLGHAWRQYGSGAL